MTSSEVQERVIEAYPQPIETVADAVAASELVQAALSIQMDTTAFLTGFVEAQTDPRSSTRHQPTEADIAGIIRNLCEIAKDGLLTESVLRHDAGVIAGWVARGTSAF